jgi:hypothetical protein
LLYLWSNDAKLPETDLTAGKLRNAIITKGKKSVKLEELFTLENQENSWLFHAKAIRDYSTHISNVPRAYHIGGIKHLQVYLKNPKNDKKIERHFVDEFTDWLASMNTLLDKLRISAIKNNAP